MRSYEAARSYFNFLGVLSWGVIAIGAIVALFSIVAAGEMSRGYGGAGMAGLAGILPAAVIMFTGFMGLVIVQIGRAGVDTAEYTQQMLKIARDQLEVSRQALRGPHSPANSFADVGDGTEGSSSAYENLESKRDESEPIDTVNAAIENAIETYKGHAIEKSGPAFLVGNKGFLNLEAARVHIDALVAK